MPSNPWRSTANTDRVSGCNAPRGSTNVRSAESITTSNTTNPRANQATSDATDTALLPSVVVARRATGALALRVTVLRGETLLACAGRRTAGPSWSLDAQCLRQLGPQALERDLTVARLRSRVGRR